jgi:DNA-binding phage protein
MKLIRQDWRIAQFEGLSGAAWALAKGQINDERQLAQCLRAYADDIDPQFSRVFWVHILAMHHGISEIAQLSGENPQDVWRRLLRKGDASLHAGLTSEQLQTYVRWEI